MEHPGDDLLARFEIQGSYERFAIDKQPGPPESWNGATPGNTLAIDGHHAVLCHGVGRRHRPAEARAAQILANGFLATYDTAAHEPAPERLTTAARHAYRMLEESATRGNRPGFVIPGLVAACITTRGIDWLQIGQGWLFIQQHDGDLTELTTNEPDDEETRTEGGGLDGTWRSSWNDGLEPQEIREGTVIVSAGNGINSIPRSELSTAVRSGGASPARIAEAIRLAAWRHDPELARGTPSVTVGVIMHPYSG